MCLLITVVLCYEDSMLPVYVDYTGNIMPIIDRQSNAATWPPTHLTN